ncbi:hypothetical protein BDK88_1628 [Natrinema hispanicum]|uniref:Uncharacterized protein n=1 Tax=Natrinema hispanicum TaxID=392421 RepID=A0A482YAS5_9EURY|nr:hypothetical protein BDK88_1628 [Natrinema hispanicum]
MVGELSLPADELILITNFLDRPSTSQSILSKLTLERELLANQSSNSHSEDLLHNER